MSQMNSLLTERIKSNNRSSKMAALAKQSADGNLSSFAGVFSISDLSEQEKNGLEEMLREYAQGKENLQEDLRNLISITSEVKAINNQAALLHGERIQKAHAILTRYRDGAFTAWLMNTYGNRQTPYNFLQYYEFCEAMPKTLRPRIELMPRQAVYTLASREGSTEKKQEIVQVYNGQTKDELLQMIRDAFPLSLKDRRRQNMGENAILNLERTCSMLSRHHDKLTKGQKARLQHLLETIHKLLD